MRKFRYTVAGLLCTLPLAASAAEYDFDLAAYDKKSWQFTGYLSYTGEQQGLNTDATLYTLNFADTGLQTNLRQTVDAELRGQYNWDQTGLYLALQGSHVTDSHSEADNLRIMEGYLAHQATTQLRYEVGKRTLKWGKGYAWTPVGLVERVKDPLDPELSREGYVLAAADYVQSGGGDLRTWGLNTVLLPVDAQLNPEYGSADNYLAAKLYLLWLDNDIDLVVIRGANTAPRFGLDFSRNLASNFELHAEWALSQGATRLLLQPDLSLATDTLDAQAWLLGMRYLTEGNLTAIVEVYHDDSGYTAQAMQDFYSQVAAATTPGELAALKSAAAAGYGSSYAMQNYLYLRLTQKEPFDLIYWTPALTWIQNLDDGSYNAGAELVYTGVDDLELRLRLSLPSGGSLTEFGEKPSDQRLELRLRYFF